MNVETDGVLLAKSLRVGGKITSRHTLSGHSADVAKSFRALFGTVEAPTRMLERWLRFFKLDEQEHGQTFLRHGTAACCLHDVGKANDSFQACLRNRSERQLIRHEHLSGLIIWLPPIRNWLGQELNLDIQLLISSAIGHHLRVGRDDFAAKLIPDQTRINVFPGGVNEILRLLALEMNVSPPAAMDIPPLWDFAKGRPRSVSVAELKEELAHQLHLFSKDLRRDETRKRLHMAVRASLVIADSAGSGLPREGEDCLLWIEKAQNAEKVLNQAAIERKVISPRRKQIEANGKVFNWDSFQLAADGLAERSLLIAPCGSGKTLAAWRWISAQVGKRSVSRAVFLYPTRATATEGFRDYVSWAPESDAALMHGTSQYDLEGMFTNPEDDRFGRDFSAEDRLFALAYWQRRIFSATVDQFLGFMQNSYRATCMLPILTDSVVVVDEVHSSDKELFSALKLFLRSFDVPVLCMTASLPQERKAELQDCGLQLFPEDVAAFPDLAASAEMPRYRVARLKDTEAAMRFALRHRDEGRKVLWVVNTVSRCQEIAGCGGFLCYHSRFKLEDRGTRHNAVINGFANEGHLVVVTTQVCEMSLDLDADVLISETAPITALIQRMGRCNRRAKPGSGKLGLVAFYDPATDAPYGVDDLGGRESFVDALVGRDVSQATLQRLLAKLGPDEVEVDRYSSFLDAGPWATSREKSLRESNEFTVPAILDSDIPEYLSLSRTGKPTDGLLVPVPRRFARSDPRLGDWPLTAPASHYNPLFGFMEKELEG